MRKTRIDSAFSCGFVFALYCWPLYAFVRRILWMMAGVEGEGTDSAMYNNIPSWLLLAVLYYKRAE